MCLLGQYRFTVPHKINGIDCISKIERFRPKLVRGGKLFFACFLMVNINLPP